MPKASVLQSGFNTGEVSPLFYGSVENPRYKKGLETLENFIPTLQGPLVRRPATKYVTNVKDSANPPKFIRFNFSATQNYMLEFGHQYIRFYTNNGQAITGGATQYLISGSTSQPVGFNFYATRLTQLPQQNETIFTTTPVAPASILELKTFYSIADIPLLRWAQSGDTIYLVHPNYPIYKLQRQSNLEWKISQVQIQDGPYLPLNVYATLGDNLTTKLKITSNIVEVTNGVAVSNATAGAGGQILITTGAAHGFKNGQDVFIYGITGTTEANNISGFHAGPSGPQTRWTIQVVSPTTFLLLGSVFVNAYTGGGTVVFALFDALNSTDYLRTIQLTIAGIRYWGYIAVIYDAATVGVIQPSLLIYTFPAGPSTADAWQLGVWKTGNYPACTAFHQDRLWFGGAPKNPQEVNSSNTGLYEVFSPSDPGTLSVKDNNSCQFVLNSPDQNALRWMKSTAQGLLAGSYSAEWAMTPSGNSEAITPTNFNAQETSFFGSSNTDAVKIGNAVMYIQRAARKLRELVFYFMGGTFRSTDITEISEHITLPTITKLSVQKETQPLIWSLRSDGVLCSLVYNRDDLALSVGWARHILGGKGDVGGNPPVVYDMEIMLDPTASFDQMWLIVKRYINGATIYAVEYMTKIFDDSIAQADAFQGDCGATYAGAPATVVSGLSWLIGETVSVLTDGGLQPDCVVNNAGQITLAKASSKVQIGYSFKSRGKLLRAEAGSAEGTSVGQTRRAARVAFQLRKVGDLAFGTNDFSNLIDWNFNQADVQQADTAIPLFSGIIREGLESDYGFDSQLCFEMKSMLPGTIQSISTFVEEFDV